MSAILPIDDTRAVKVGAPYVGIYGTAKCVYCMHPLQIMPDEKPGTEIGKQMLVMCPHCRRQMYRGLDPSGGPDLRSRPEMETGGVEMSHNLPAKGDLPFDTAGYYLNPTGLTGHNI